MVAPATTISVVISLITVLKLYDIITALTGGGPAFSTQSVAMYIISVGFSNDVPVRFRAPRFSEAAFQLSPGGGEVALHLQHFE